MIPDEELKNITGGCGADLFEEDHPDLGRLLRELKEVEELIAQLAVKGEYERLERMIARRHEIIRALERLRGE